MIGLLRLLSRRRQRGSPDPRQSILPMDPREQQVLDQLRRDRERRAATPSSTARKDLP